MSCDIHLHVEIKIKGRWLHWNQPRITQHYRLFYRLAGVRGPFADLTPISSPRGIPADITETTALDLAYEGSDAHSGSFLSLEEIMSLEDDESWMYPGEEGHDANHNYFGYLFGGSFGGLMKYADSAGKKMGVEDVRFVFWFDC